MVNCNFSFGMGRILLQDPMPAGNLEGNEPTLNCRAVPNGIGIQN
jgi:hypothetical protein